MFGDISRRIIGITELFGLEWILKIIFPMGRGIFTVCNHSNSGRLKFSSHECSEKATAHSQDVNSEHR